jgi:hypothetical protein
MIVSSRKRSIVIQTGAWDLQCSTLRLMIGFPENSQFLIDAISDITTGITKCGNLEKIVFVTPVPHPICRKYDQMRCEHHKGSRTNANIATLREFYLKGLHTGILDRVRQLRNATKNTDNGTEPERYPPPQLHIVDAFDIIRSRLHYKDEAYKLSHFMCMCEGDYNILRLISFILITNNVRISAKSF